MNCPEFDTLMMLMDGELQGEDLKAVSEHVMSCSNCRKIIDSQIKLETSWRDSFVIPESDKFRRLEQDIFNRINSHSRWKAFIPAAAGIIAVLLGVKLIIGNQPTPDRITELSRGIREEEYMADDEYRSAEQTEILSENASEHVSDMIESAPVTVPSESFTTVEEEGSGKAVSGLEADGNVQEEIVQQVSVHEEVSIVGSTSTIDSSDRGSDGQSLTSDSEIAAGAAVGGSGGLYGYCATEESEESEVPAEATGIEVAEDAGYEIQMDEICDVTLSLDTDTAGLETVQTVQTASGISDETEDNRSEVQSGELIFRFNDFPAGCMESPDEGVYVELAFDADGMPDSCTILLLDSLCAGWNDYIPFYYRDTVLVVPLSDVQSLFIGESAVTVESMEE